MDPISSDDAVHETGALPVERRGGRILVDALRANGVDRIFCVPGESYLEVLDALFDTPEIDLVVCRHEGAAANMAEADGKLTGRPGICFVTRGPGSAHASVGVHTAFHDSTPMILFVGQVETTVRSREAFQEVDIAAMFAPLAKWTAEIDSVARIPELLRRAFHVATSGRQGPVVLSLPENVLSDLSAIADLPPITGTAAAPAPAEITAAMEMLALAKRPLVIVGGSGWTETSTAALRGFVERNDLPVVSSFRRQDILDNRHASYVGHLSLATSKALAARVAESDVIFALGARLSDVTTRSYTLPAPPRGPYKLIHAYAEPDEIGRVFDADVSIVGSMERVAPALAQAPPIAAPGWTAWREEMRREYLASIDPAGVKTPGTVDVGAIVAHVSQRLGSDGIVTNGAGNYTIWLHRFYSYRRLGAQLAPTSGAMGYGLPAAIAAKLRHPGRTVVCFAGDGCFMMYPQELATAMQQQAGIVVVVVNNAIYGTIRMHQQRRFPHRMSGTDMVNPDFVAFARSFGAYAEAVEATAEFAPAFERAINAGTPALLDVRVDPSQLTPDFRFEA